MAELPPTAARILLTLGAVFSGLSVAAGAFASHALRESLSDRAASIFETGARYQMYHGLALILLGLLWVQWRSRWLSATAIAFTVGIVLFSGSLYALSLSGIRILGAITPLGGVAFLIGWGCLAVAAWQVSQ